MIEFLILAQSAPTPEVDPASMLVGAIIATLVSSIPIIAKSGLTLWTRRSEEDIESRRALRQLTENQDKRLDALLTRIDKLEKEIEREQSEAEEALALKDEQHRKAIETMRLEHESALSVAKTEREAESKRILAELAELRTEAEAIKARNAELERKSKQLDELQPLHDKLVADYRTLTEQRDGAVEENTRYREQIKLLEERIAQLEKRIADLEKEILDLTEGKDIPHA